MSSSDREEGQEQTFISHLVELRSRLLKAVAGVLIVLVVGHDHLTPKPLRQFHFRLVIRVLLGDDLPAMRKIIPCQLHALQQGTDTAVDIRYIVL